MDIAASQISLYQAMILKRAPKGRACGGIGTHKDAIARRRGDDPVMLRLEFPGL